MCSAQVTQPTAFIAGTDDSVVTMSGGVENIKKSLAAGCADMQEPVFVEGAGHWIQQESAALVNEKVIEFANTHKALFSHPSKL